MEILKIIGWVLFLLLCITAAYFHEGAKLNPPPRGDEGCKVRQQAKEREERKKAAVLNRNMVSE